MGVLRKVWRGSYGLPAAFWLFYILGCFAILILALILVSIARLAGVPTVGAIVVNALLIAYLIFVMVGVWRSANHYAGGLGWAIAAKIVICLHAGSMLLRFLNGKTLVMIDGARATIELAFLGAGWKY